MSVMETVVRERQTETSIRKLDTHEIVDLIHRLEDEAEAKEAKIERLREEAEQAKALYRETLTRAVTAEAENEQQRTLLGELHALVNGECPALLDEDRGGNSRLALEIEDALAGKEAKP